MWLFLLFWQVKKDSAQTEPAWKGAGQKPGIQIWRIKKFKVIQIIKIIILGII
jgi:hypothetical protein